MNAKYTVSTDMGSELKVEVMRFPSGEVAAKVIMPEKVEDVQLDKSIAISVQGYEPDTLFIIANLKDSLDSLLRESGLDKQVSVRLFLGFTPNARYDRHMVDGDGFALRVFADMLNLCKFDRIMVVDPHSDATTALIRNCQAHKQEDVMEGLLNTFNKDGYDVLIAPDAGAYKKIFNLSKKMKLPVVCMSKVRDLETGNIIGTALLDTLPEAARCLVVDDLCDGGRTFIGAAETLRQHGAVQVDLAVTHGIFSQGVAHLLTNGIDHIYTTDTFSELVIPATLQDKVFQYKFF